MIGYLNGKVILEEKDFIVVNVNGVGYKVFVPDTSDMLDSDVELYVTTFFKEKEETITLFGFLSRFDQRVFEILCEANGLGPKTALKFLTVLSGEEIANAIISENENILITIPGVSSKKAQKYILELKDKFTQLPVRVTLNTGSALYKLEAVDALMALGYNRAPALKAVEEICASENLKETSKIITKALAVLSKKNIN